MVTLDEESLALRTSDLVFLVPLGVGGGEGDSILDATLVTSTLDAEVALFAPVWIPGVGDLPVLGAVIHTPKEREVQWSEANTTRGEEEDR